MRLRRYTFFDLGFSDAYEDTSLNDEILNRVSEQCYLPANRLLTKLIASTKGKVSVTFSLTGVLLDQLASKRKDVLTSFQQLMATGGAGMLGETFYHSLAGLYHTQEFARQVQKHRDAIWQNFGIRPKVFRNTELLYAESLAQGLRKTYNGILAEGVSWYLQEATPNQVFKVPSSRGMGLLLRNYRLSDDIAFRFGQKVSDAKAYVDRIKAEPGEVVNLFMDYETFGEHHAKSSGIFDFLEAFLCYAAEEKIKFISPEKAIKKAEKPSKLSVPTVTSWADSERDASAWNGNEMQRLALKKVYGLGHLVEQANTEQAWDTWGRLQTSDHFYYMSTKSTEDGQVHDYFNPFPGPYDAYIHYMNVLSDFELRLKKAK